MNYLAHVLLSANHPGDLIGNLSVDFIRGRVPRDQPPAIRTGMARYHAIDTFTDAHPAFRASCRRIRPPHQRYAGVIVDLFYDHYLARAWSDHARAPLPAVCHWAYQHLRSHQRVLPPRLQQALPYMIADNWLGAYRQVAGIERALRGLSSRARRDIALQTALADLADFDADFAADFARFFPELVAHIREHHGGPLVGDLPADELTLASCVARP